MCISLGSRRSLFGAPGGGKGVLPATVTRECDDLLALGFANGEAGWCYVKKRGMYGPSFESFELVLRPMGSLWHARAPTVREGGRRRPRTSFVRSPSFRTRVAPKCQTYGVRKVRNSAWRRARGAPASGSVRRIRV
jgi:hypothetical protein